MDYLEQLNQLKKEFYKTYQDNTKTIDEYYDIFDIEFTYNSSKIHGCELTLDEIRAFLQNGITSTKKNLFDYIITQNIYDTTKWFEYFLLSGQRFDSKILKNINSKILKDIDVRVKIIDGKEVRTRIVKGDYRKINLPYLDEGIRRAQKEEYKKITERVERLLDNIYYKKDFQIIDCARFFFDFLDINPFDMANGRISRVIISYPLKKIGLPQIMFTLEDKEDFKESISKCKNGNILSLQELISKKVIESYERIINYKLKKGKI